MAAITLEKVTKVYPNGFEAVHQLDLEVADGEFMVLVGPSGSGKTTALRMVAGLEEITEGRVLIGGRVMNDVPEKDRDIAMVFQNYALYPSMTVAGNIGFALKLRRVPKEEIKKKVAEAVGLLGLTEWIDRKPGQLSGGQRQRVAMGRALVREPSAFLMDEPLSNLDAKLRVQMRAEVARIQRHLGVATLYVTHDQVEAMTMGSRIAVLRDGVLQQLDTPQTVYDHPTNMFVAGFIGSPAMNFFPSEVRADNGQMTVDAGAFEIKVPQEFVPKLKTFGRSSVVLGLRPEDMYDRAWAPPITELNPTRMKVDVVEHMGSEIHMYLIAGNHNPVAKVDSRTNVAAGDTIDLMLDASRMHIFDPSSQESLF